MVARWRGSVSPARTRGLALTILLALGAYCVTQIELSNSITHFIPSRSEAEQVQLSIELVDSTLARRMVLAISQTDDARRIADQLAARLRGHPEVAWAASGLSDDLYLAFYTVYFDHRLQLAAIDPESTLPDRLTPSALQQRARETRERLHGPEAMMVSRTLPADPLGFFEEIVARGQRFVAPERSSQAARNAFVELGLASSPFDSERQTPLLEFIQRSFRSIAADREGEPLLQQSGANRVAVAAEQSIRGDITRISSLSISVVCLLFFGVFRSIRALGIALLPPLFGFAFALAIQILQSDRVHGITIAFGFILIGVAIDYPIHLINHHALGRAENDANRSLAEIRASLLLSAATTMIAFLSLSASGLPGLSQMGTFAGMGVAASLALTIVALPAFLDHRPSPTAAQRRIADRSVRMTSALRQRPSWPWIGIAALVLVSVSGIARLHWNDDPSALMALDTELVAEGQRVQQMAAAFDGGHFVAAVAPDTQSALELNEEVHRKLTRLIDSGELGGVGSMVSFIFSEALQARNLAVLRSVPDLADRVAEAFAAEGFERSAFSDFERALAEGGLSWLDPAAFEDTPLERLLFGLIPLDDRVAVITLLREADSGEVIRTALEGLEGAHYINSREIMEGVYEGYRQSTLRMVALGAFVVGLMLQLRYRSVGRGLLAFGPAILGVSTTLGALGLLGTPVNVVSAISLLVVLGMGVDYGIFAVDSAATERRQGATHASLVVSCVTSVFVFGVLALSEQPVLRAIGATTGIGVSIALVTAPLVMALAQREG